MGGGFNPLIRGKGPEGIGHTMPDRPISHTMKGTASLSEDGALFAVSDP